LGLQGGNGVGKTGDEIALADDGLADALNGIEKDFLTFQVVDGDGFGDRGCLCFVPPTDLASGDTFS
jgi:hypothetical protein